MSTVVSSEPPKLSNFRILAPWYAVEFLNSYACTLLLVCVPYLLKELYHRPPAAALWQSAAWGLCYVPFALFAGILADRWGPRTLLTRAATLAVPATAVGLLAIPAIAVHLPGLPLYSVGVLFLVMMFYNATNTASWPALEAAITRSPGSVRLSTRTGIYNVIWSSAGFLAFPTVDLIRTLGWPLMFLIPTALCALAAFIANALTIPQALLLASEAPDDNGGGGGGGGADTHQAPPNARSLLLMAWIANPMAYVAINVLMALTPSVSPHAASLNSIWKFTTVVGFVLWWKCPFWHYKTSLILAAYAGLIASFALIVGFADPAAGTPLLILIPAQILFGLSVSLIYSSSLYYSMHASAGGGSHAGMHEALIGGGIALGCAVAALASYTPSLTPITLAVTTILLTGGTIISTLALRSPRRLVPSP